MKAVDVTGPIRAWHFMTAPAKGEQPRLGYGDDRIVEVGKALTVNPDMISPCEYGLHASEDILDALSFNRGTLLCRVELAGRIVFDAMDDDKHCASVRTALHMADIADQMRTWNIWMLTTALDRKWPDAPAAVRAWAEGGDDMRAAKDACNDYEGKHSELAHTIYMVTTPHKNNAEYLASRILNYLDDLGISRDESRANLLGRIAPLFDGHI